MREISTGNYKPPEDALLFPEYNEASRYHDAGKFGFITIASKNKGRWQETRFPVKEYPVRLKYIDKTKDSFITQAEFYRPPRAIANFLRISNSFIDLDIYNIYKDKRSPEELTYAALMFCSDYSIPTPNLILFSGQGLYLKWFYDDPLPYQAFAKWNRVQQALLEKLAPIGADRNAIDISRVLRIEATVNSKTGEYAKVMFDDGKSWNFDDLADEVLPLSGEQLRELRKERQIEKELRNIKNASDNEVRKAIRRQSYFNAQVLAADRLWDIQHVIVPMQYGKTGVPEGSHKRDAFLFAGASCIAMFVNSPGQFEREVKEFQKGIIPSMPLKEVRSSTATIRKRLEDTLTKGHDARYRLTNEYLVKDLEVSRETQQRCKTIISRDEKRERNKKQQEHIRRQKGAIEKHIYKAKQKGQLALHIEKALELREKGLSRKQIAEVMGKSRQSIDIYMNYATKKKC